MDMICRFVFKNGELFGESIDEYGDYLIVKVAADFLAIPKNCIENVDEEGIHITEFNEEEAKEIGAKWIEEKSKPVTLEELEHYKFNEE